ncbi:ATP-binding protein [Chryseolinea sp. T2]|uniref:sensor histidine kinase n=1 Tax=Chryseolinea sp. T2 TaxID=3129255 RepID=UPI0030785D90
MKELSWDDQEIEISKLRKELAEANDTLEAIRTGQIDALVVSDDSGHSLFTLKSADRAYRLFIEQMTEGAVTLNHDGLITYCNSQFSQLVEYSLSNVMGNYFSDFIFNDDLPLYQELLSKGWTNNVKAEMRLRGATRSIDVQLSLNALEMDGDTSLSVIVTDLTQQKEIERELKAKNDQLRELNDALVASNHDLQQFASVASHDLQEPLRKIQVFTKLLKDNSFHQLPDTSRNFIEKIFNASQRMKVLIVDILTYSKLSAKDILTEKVDLKQIVTEIIEDFDLRIAEKNARVNVADLCEVEGNRGQLRQVFHNLISNALKFVSPDRHPIIEIRMKKLDPVELGLSIDDHSRYCRFTVSDNGIGFDETYTSSIFNLFETLNPKTAYEGSGIGLAIAKKIIEKHNGMIVAKSSIGEGSEFNVILPLKQPVADNE